jgi:hypothetical protein
MSTSLINLNVEISNENLDALVKASDSMDGVELAQAAAEIPRLVIEVNRLRQERDERVASLGKAKRKIQEQSDYIETLRPRAGAERRLRELEESVSSIVAQLEKVTRERDDKVRTIDSLEKRVQALLSAMVEMARGTNSERYVQEAQDQRERAERAETKLAELEAKSGT